jgi:hypothetical protein
MKIMTDQKSGVSIAASMMFAALCMAGSAHALQAPPQNEIILVSLGITGVSPATPIAGTAVTITYELHATALDRGTFTGTVKGSFQNEALQTPGAVPAPTVTVTPNAQPVTGTLVIVSPVVGSDTLTLSFDGGVRCAPPLHVGLPLRCAPRIYATATTTLTVIEPTVHVRIAGINFTDLARPDNHGGDSSTPNAGYQCVTHDPDCGWFIFAKGNDGTDKFFNSKPLPAGVTLEGVDYTPFWPIGLDSADAGGNGLGSGTYGSHLQSGPSVQWNNACFGTFAQSTLHYSISFRVSMPEGTDLAEPATEPAAQPNTPCTPAGYSTTAQGAAPASSPPFYLIQTVTNGTIWFQNTFGTAGSAGSIQSITNGENFQISLLKSTNLPAGCTKPGNVPVNPGESISGVQLQGLYGNVSYPKQIGACINNTDLSTTRQAVLTVIGYQPAP